MNERNIGYLCPVEPSPTILVRKCPQSRLEEAQDTLEGLFPSTPGTLLDVLPQELEEDVYSSR